MNDDDLFGPRPTPAPRKPDPKASELGRELAMRRWGGTAADARDEAIEAVTESERLEWRKRHDEELQRFLAERGDRGFIAEEFRQWFLGRGNPPPHHHNTWGGMWMQVVKAGIVEKTGNYLPMQERKSHARSSPEFRRKGDR